ncbi:MAG: sigma-54-dependent Fis family transcriptional regulator [Nitrospinae bacterium]|nr:sigma-54-dependent Fis family transcriptional regulator [Nitrospinota bacterium]MBF0634712.1 sigma-54-dependent Fis family transcriptional regulator [Nitrospinota bacterium]
MACPEHPVLIVDDEVSLLRACSDTLFSAGIDNVVTIQDGREALEYLRRTEVSLALLDVHMPHVSGEDIMAVIKEERPGTPVIILTGHNDLETAVRLMKKGSADYLVKPVEWSKLVSSVTLALEMGELARQNSMLKTRLLDDSLEKPEAFTAIVASSRKMRSIFQYAESIARAPWPILVTGETGVGKELMACSLHVLSERKGKFVAVNVAGLDDTLFADTLFGHRKGAFTGADQNRAGMIEQAGGGTLFLDEIGDLGLQSQVKLLRLLQEREYYPLGADVPKQSDARVIVATHRDIPALVRQERFRKDLYYRLKAHHIHIPPLRDRPEDIPALVHHFAEEAAVTLGKKKPSIPRELYDLLGSYHFPGNVRELASMVNDAVSRSMGGTVSLSSFRDVINAESADPSSNPHGAGIAGISINSTGRIPTLKEAAESLVEEAMRRANGNQAVAAGLLGITRTALNKRLKKPGKLAD